MLFEIVLIAMPVFDPFLRAGVDILSVIIGVFVVERLLQRELGVIMNDTS